MGRKDIEEAAHERKGVVQFRKELHSLTSNKPTVLPVIPVCTSYILYTLLASTTVLEDLESAAQIGPSVYSKTRPVANSSYCFKCFCINGASGD
jgi:hypothetical protein